MRSLWSREDTKLLQSGKEKPQQRFPRAGWWMHPALSSIKGLSSGRSTARSASASRTFSALTRSYDRWFDAVYLDKYFYLGDFELMRLAFLLDLGLYYLGVASQPFKFGASALCQPIFTVPVSTPVYYVMRSYGRRFAAMARSRRARGVWGRRNDGHRFLFGGYSFEGWSRKPILKALLGWLWLELREGWRTWFSAGRPAEELRTAPVKTEPLVPDELRQAG